MKRVLAEMTWPDGSPSCRLWHDHRYPAVGCNRAAWSSPPSRHGHISGRGTSGAAGVGSTRCLGRAGAADWLFGRAFGFRGPVEPRSRTLAGVIVHCARRMAAWGVRRLLLLSAHGGNGQALQLATLRLAEELRGLQVEVLGSSTTASDALLAVAEAEGVSPEAVGLHAGDGETSEMLCLRPDLVRMERVIPGYAGPMEEIMPRLLQAGLRPITPTGTLGDASRADGIRGERYLAEQIESYRQRLTPPHDIPQCLQA